MEISRVMCNVVGIYEVGQSRARKTFEIVKTCFESTLLDVGSNVQVIHYSC